MLRKKWNPNPALKLWIAESGFLIIYEKPADSGFGLPSLIIMVDRDRNKNTENLG